MSQQRPTSLPALETAAARSVALLLTPIKPDPAGTGLALRAWAWLLTLTHEHEVSVLVVAPDAEQPPLSTILPAREQLVAGDCMVYTRRWRLVAGWCLPWLAGLTRTVIMDLRHLRPEKAQALARMWPADDLCTRVERIVAFRLCVHDFALATAARFPQARLELDLDDLESGTRWSLARAHARRGQLGSAWLTAMVAWQYRCLEDGVLKRYDKVWLAAPEDAAVLQARLGPCPAVGCEPNRLQPPARPLAPYPAAGPVNLLFVGSLNYGPNQDALVWLLRRVMPLLRLHLTSGWRLIVAGRGAQPALVHRLRQAPEVEFLPNVSDLHEIYSRAHVALVPLHSGGGTKIKTLEAFAHQRPVVATPHGVRGLGVSHGQHCLVADGAAAFAAHIVRLIQDPVLAHRLSQAALLRYEEAFALRSAATFPVERS